MENMVHRVKEEIENYISAEFDKNDIYIDFAIGVERDDIVVGFANCEEIPATIFEGIWKKSSNTITITEYERVLHKVVYVGAEN